jgi:F-type H+-transporting ATPase subunit a
MELDVFKHKTISPFSAWGYTGNFWEINLDTIFATWISIAVMIVLVVCIRLAIRRPFSIYTYGIEQITGYYVDMVKESIGYFDGQIFTFVFGIALFTWFCNVTEVLPFAEAATSDVNTTLAIGISSFAFVQFQGLKHKGFGYFKKYFTPFFFFFPVNVLGQLSKIASLSFRLFGNIISGTIIISLISMIFEKTQSYFLPLAVLTLIASLLMEHYSAEKKLPRIARMVSVGTIISSVVPVAKIVLCLGVGTIQAFVIGLLTNMYVSAEVGESGGH